MGIGRPAFREPQHQANGFRQLATIREHGRYLLYTVYDVRVMLKRLVQQILNLVKIWFPRTQQDRQRVVCIGSR